MITVAILGGGFMGATHAKGFARSRRSRTREDGQLADDRAGTACR